MVSVEGGVGWVKGWEGGGRGGTEAYGGGESVPWRSL